MAGRRCTSFLGEITGRTPCVDRESKQSCHAIAATSIKASLLQATGHSVIVRSVTTYKVCQLRAIKLENFAAALGECLLYTSRPGVQLSAI